MYAPVISSGARDCRHRVETGARQRSTPGAFLVRLEWFRIRIEPFLLLKCYEWLHVLCQDVAVRRILDEHVKLVLLRSNCAHVDHDYDKSEDEQEKTQNY